MMAKKYLPISGKSLSIFLFMLLIGVICFGYKKHKDFVSKISWLESENYDLNDKIEDLESHNEDLQINLDDAITEKEKAEILYEVLFANCDNLIERRSSYASYGSSNYYGNSNSNDGVNIDLPKTLSKSYLDGGYIIKPDFGNLHLLMKMSQSDFESKMRSNNYSLTTDKDMYVSNSTKSTYCTIKKEWNQIIMIITENYSSDLDTFFSKKDITYRYENGEKVYNYTRSSSDYSLRINNKINLFAVRLISK